MSDVPKRVLVVDDDAVRRSATCARIERAGYLATPVLHLVHLGELLEDDLPTVVLRDVSLPQTAAEIRQREAELRVVVDRRCPIILYGNRPEMEVSELDGRARASAHVPSGDGGRSLMALLKRLLPLETASRTTPPSSEGNMSRLLQNVRLLLIDDSEMTLEIMQAKLSEVGFDVRIAVALGEVRSIVAHWQPNLIVADIVRPDIPGDELCARLKESVRRPDVLIVLCSSLPDEDIAPLARAARADGWVSKAAGLDALVGRIQALSYVLLRGRSDRPMGAP